MRREFFTASAARFAFVPALLLPWLVLQGGCTTTRLVSSWRHPAFTPEPPYRKVLVVCVSKQSDVRRLVEDHFVAQLRAQRGAEVEGVPSYRFIPEDGQVDEKRLEEAVREAGAQAVLVTRLVGRSRRATTYSDVTPAYAGHPGGYYGYYGWAWSGPLYTSTSTYEYDVVTLQNRLFDVGAKKLVWAGTTETEVPGNREREIEKLTRLITGELAKAKLI